MSTHEVRVHRINEIEKHPNADRLGLVRIDGFTAIVRLGDFKPGDLAAYIEPDYVVPDLEQFTFLKGKLRIRSWDGRVGRVALKLVSDAYLERAS
jgi:hypothetical protein